jgi:hypothetical protein
MPHRKRWRVAQILLSQTVGYISRLSLQYSISADTISGFDADMSDDQAIRDKRLVTHLTTNSGCQLLGQVCQMATSSLSHADMLKSNRKEKADHRPGR